MGDRMGKSLKYAGISVQGMADYLEVSRNTVSTWINDRITPSKQTRRLWALRTGVPLQWLETGVDEPTPGPGPGVTVGRVGLEPTTDGLQARRTHYRAAA